MSSKQIHGSIEQNQTYKDFYIKIGRCYFLSKKSLTTGAISKTKNKDMAVKRTTIKEIKRVAQIFWIKLKKQKRWVP